MWICAKGSVLKDLSLGVARGCAGVLAVFTIMLMCFQKSVPLATLDTHHSLHSFQMHAKQSSTVKLNIKLTCPSCPFSNAGLLWQHCTSPVAVGQGSFA